MILTLIAAMGKNRVIGNQGKIPWHLPEDMAHFKESTMGHPIIMGRKTFDSIGRVLPGRANIVITRSDYGQSEGMEVVHSLEEAIERCASEPEAFVIGGAQIYAQAYPYADRLILTFIEHDFEGDAFFPDFPFEKDFQIISETRILTSLKENLSYRFVTMERRNSQ